MRTVPPSRLALPVCVLAAMLTAVGPAARSCALERGFFSSSLSLQHPRSADVAFAMHDAIERGELKLDRRVLDDPGTAVGAQLVRAFPPRD